MKHVFLVIFLWALLSLLLTGCKHYDNNSTDNIASPTLSKYTPPRYDLVQLRTTADTLHFPLDDSTFRSIKSFNLFSKNGEEFIAFFDERSLAVNIYNFKSQKKVKNISIKNALKGRKMFKTTAYVVSPDSIFVNNNTTLYLIDSSEKIKTRINFLEEPAFAWAIFENQIPGIMKDGRLYASVRPYVNETSLNALKKWKVLYEFDLQNKQAKLCYGLPEFLKKDLYGRRFLDHSYCYNDRGHFVFSFPADSAIYETDLKNYHVAYSGRSRFQQGMIRPINKKDLGEYQTKNYRLKDSYGAIYFDPFKKRYLRIAESGLSLQDYEARKLKAQRIIILDEHFRIIGESRVDNSISVNSLFITKNGRIYARVLRKDEDALHFVQFSYMEKNNEPVQIVSNENPE